MSVTPYANYNRTSFELPREDGTDSTIVSDNGSYGIGFDAVKLIALSRIERRPLRLDLSRYPHLPKMDVKTTAAADYAVLVPGKAA